MCFSFRLFYCNNEKHTSADASDCPEAGPVVALKPLGVVAWFRYAAVFVELFGADLATPAAV